MLEQKNNKRVTVLQDISFKCLTKNFDLCKNTQRKKENQKKISKRENAGTEVAARLSKLDTWVQLCGTAPRLRADVTAANAARTPGTPRRPTPTRRCHRPGTAEESAPAEPRAGSGGPGRRPGPSSPPLQGPGTPAPRWRRSAGFRAAPRWRAA